MRNLLILTFLTMLAAASGCMNRNPCGNSWRPGYYLFGAGRQTQAQYECCDPCMSAPTMAAPCCQ